MSSWGSGSKFSNLQQVGEFSILGSKSVTFFFFFFFLWGFKILCSFFFLFFLWGFNSFYFFFGVSKFYIHFCSKSSPFYFTSRWEAFFCEIEKPFFFVFYWFRRIWVLVGGGVPDFVYFSFFNFRVGTYNLPPGSSDSASPQRGAKPRVWWGWLVDGDQKCPLIFFILCKYIDKVYTYIYIW